MAGDDDEKQARHRRRLERIWKLLGTVTMLTSIPSCEKQMSFLFRLDQLYPEGYIWPGFAPFHDLLVGRTYAVEHFSGSLRSHERKRMLTLNINLAFEYGKWRRDGCVAGHPLAGRLPPRLVVAGAARPDAFLRDGILSADSEIRGLYRGLGEHAELLYLWFYGLDPEDRRWGVLRWAVPQHPRSPVDRMRYFEDPAVPVEQKNAVWSMIMSEQYAIDLGDVQSQYHVVLEKGVQQGIERGLEQGIERGLEQGMEALVMIARNVLTRDELRRFQQQPISTDLLDELRQAITERLAADGDDS